MITRRRFLQGSGGAVASLLLPSSMMGIATNAYVGSHPLLKSETVDSKFFGNDIITKTWGYNGMTPGPTIRVHQGERVQVQFENTIAQPSSVHWHGIRIDNKMDGVPHITQPLVAQGKFFDYDFIAPDAGTYWYHAHNKSWEQVARGLYGPLIVFDKTPPAVDRDIIVIVDDWLLDKNAQILDSFNSLHDMSHAGRLGNSAKVFFRDTITDHPPSPLKKNQRVRFRLINPSTDRTFTLKISGAKYRIVAYDGMPIATPKSTRTITLASAQRMDIIADISGTEFGIDFVDKNQTFRFGTLPVQGNIQAHSTPISALAPHALAKPNLRNATKLDFVLEGGAMSRRTRGMMMHGQGNGDSIKNIWAINDISGLGDTPYYRFKQGQTAILNMVNNTRFDHVIHLHGHHAKVLGTPDTFQDSILIRKLKKQKVAVVFDNPGKWLIHCHMLGHQVSGMKTWIEVVI